MLEYYFVLRMVLGVKAHLRCCLTRCAHCRIFFLTDHRNTGRTDLGCPFGCREAHRRKESSERSREYYRSLVGKEKKKALNQKRRRRSPGAPPVDERSPAGPASPEHSVEEAGGREGDRIELEVPLVRYLCVVVSLIEGRLVSREEVLEMLRRAVRQRSLARERRIDYVLRTLGEKPP